MASRCARSIVPLYQFIPDGYPTLVGTGTLFAVAEERFLVTAAHVASDFIKGQSVLLTSNPRTQQHLERLDYDWITAEGEFDVGVFRLSARALAVLRDLTFLRLDEIEIGPPAPKGVYVVYGYPRAWWKPDAPNLVVNVSPLQLFGSDYDGSTDAWRFDPTVHMAIELADDSMVPRSERQNVPDSLKGISGCSVWWLRGAFEKPGQFKAEDAKIVAVQTGTQNRDSVILATRWAAALVLIRRHCPDLGPAVDMYIKDEPRLVAPVTLVRPNRH
jgi:hypothetical protein